MFSNRMNFYAACAAMAVAGLARGADFSPDPSTALSLKPTFSADDAAPRQPLMRLLDDAGFASTLDQWGVNIGGLIEGSYTVSSRRPSSGLIAGREFDIQNESIVLNQIDLFVDRPVTASPTKWDFGGRMEWIYGYDAQFIHSNGLFDWQGFQEGPQNQFDPVQLYAQANIPVGNGLIVTGGKTVALIGYETINPSTNGLFSHSFAFYFGSPFTTTGITAKYALDKTYSFTVGIVRGWDQALEDNNKVPSYEGQFAYTTDLMDFYFNVITGPEENNQDSDYRTLLQGILVYHVDEKLSFALEADYGFEPNPNGSQFGTWWGGVGYVTYVLNDYATLQGRAEYFDDNDGVRGIGTQLFEITTGVNVKPFPHDSWGQNLMLRPEIRWDGSNNQVFNNGTVDSQFTFGIDAIYTF
jgi:hypothetical protein